eukprot:5068110-Alexandrium_andersonii.AAC.1
MPAGPRVCILGGTKFQEARGARAGRRRRAESGSLRTKQGHGAWSGQTQCAAAHALQRSDLFGA